MLSMHGCCILKMLQLLSDKALVFNCAIRPDASVHNISTNRNTSHNWWHGQQQSTRHRQQVQAGVDLSALGIDIPEIDAADIASYQEELGAEFDVSSMDALSHNESFTTCVLWQDGELNMMYAVYMLLHN